jgi:predicted enzyme related to lactoylglutathione lyase
MRHNPVGWFEIAVTDSVRAKQFYETLLDTTLERRDAPGFEMTWFPMDMGKWGAGGVLMKGMGYTPSATGTIVYFSVPEISAALARAETVGGKTIFPKKDIGEYGFIAWLTDSEGNTIALHTPPSGPTKA